MDCPEILASFREDLAQEIRTYSVPAFQPLAVSPWLAMSLMQKAIRRGDEEFALNGAATLFDLLPARFWHRCGIIAFEDVGIADLQTVGLVVASLSGKAFRAQLGGDWAVGSFLVKRMAQAAKCRAADDLITVAERHLKYDHARLGLTFSPLPHLIAVATGDAHVAERALALWFGVGTSRCPSDYLRARAGTPAAMFDALRDKGFSLTSVEVAREGFRKTNQVLCPFLPLLESAKKREPRGLADDVMPPQTMCGPLPSWALDMFSREGRRALKLFLMQDCQSAQWVRTHVPPPRRVDFIGNVVFAIESSLMKQRLRWLVGDELRRMATIECQGSFCPDATEIMELLRDDIPVLNEVRGHVC